ncbi:MAG: hypothetical protein KAX19_06755, partial [Candidatus Brocadiae bacterium]|nr:hypothetical protein [Candidatus Brocadiia bacterium]
WPYIRIGDEWIRFESFNPQTQQFIVPSAWRGMRGTSPAEHDAGDPVLFGSTFSSVFHNPTGKDYWGDTGE